MSKYTEWFPPHIRPVRPGVYEFDEDGWFRRWDGRHWRNGGETVAMASESSAELCHSAMGNWRGLAEKP